MSDDFETVQEHFFDPNEHSQPEAEGTQPSRFEDLQRPTRRYLARIATVGMETLELEGMPVEPKAPNFELERLTRRAALSPAMTPDYWKIDEAKFASVDEEDYELSSPQSLSVWLHRKTDQSMRQTGRGSAWVLLSPDEKKVILNIPHEYAAGAEANYRTRKAATFKSYDVAQREAVAEGTKALETKLGQMQNLAAGYDLEVANLRDLTRMLDHTWMANASNGMEVRVAATTLREGLMNLVANIAAVDNWSEDKFKKVLIGLDMRLTAGDTRKRQAEKTAQWRQLNRLYGNYLLAKKVLAENRMAQCNEEIGKRKSVVLK